MPEDVLKISGKALELEANVGCEIEFRNPKAALKTLPDTISFYEYGKGFYLGINCLIKCHLIFNRIGVQKPHFMSFRPIEGVHLL